MWTGPVLVVIDALVTHMLPSFHLDIANSGGEDLSKETWRTKFCRHVLGPVHGGCGKNNLVYDCFEACYEDVCRGVGGILTLGETMLCSSIQHSWSSRATKGADIRNIAATLGLRKTERSRRSVIQL